MKLIPATPQAIAQLVVSMRAESAAEAFATRPNDDRAALAADIAAAAAGALVARMIADDAGNPVALIGLVPAGLGLAAMLFVANDGMPAQVMAGHRWWRREFVPQVLMRFRRVEFTGSLEHTGSGRWLAWCGFVCEGVARAYGKHGEDFAHWGWVHPQWLADPPRTALDDGSAIGPAQRLTLVPPV